MSFEELTGVSTSLLFERALAIAAVEPVLQSDDYWLHVRALRVRSEPSVFETARSLCSNADPVARAAAADVLSQLGTHAHVDEFPFANESAPVLMSLLRDADTRVVSSALFALGHLDRGDPAGMIELVTHDSADVRSALAYALCGRSDDVSLGALMQLSTDVDIETRDWATFALGSQCDADSPDIREALVARLSDTDDETRGEAMLGLARRSDVRAAGAILDELGQADVLTLAIEAAGEMPRPEFLPDLEQLLAAHPDDEMMRRAVDRCRA